MEQSKSKNVIPALTLMVLAPLITEVLPGATRFSSMFVFPIEMCVWGGGAVLIRYFVRRFQLGWGSILLLAVALAVAEECVIQQTSFAPMVVRLKGVTYARAFGINYVYLVWALIYESVFVVFVPVYLVELIFPARREGLWINKFGLGLIIVLFFFGSFLAWFSWTRIARPKFYHLPVYHPSPIAFVIAVAVILTLIVLALRASSQKSLSSLPGKMPPLWILFVSGVVWATLLFGLVLLGFGISPSFPPVFAVIGGLLLAAAALFFVPRWDAAPGWSDWQTFALIFGTILGSMMVSFLGFIDQPGIDLYFKIVVDVIAFILLILLGMKVKKRMLKSRID